MAFTTELAIVGFFFAMRLCEFTATPREGRTKIIDLQGVTFRDRNNQIMPHSSPDLNSAKRVTVTFAAQKNGVKQDPRTRQRTVDPVMCPV